MSNKPYSAAWHIFNERYRVYIPRSLMIGPEYARKVGYASSGDQMVDRMQNSSLERVNQTIAGWAILIHQGAEPLLLNEDDAVPIYKAIVQHLSEWRDFSAQGLRPEFCPPIADFRALEAIAIHYHQFVQSKEPVSTNHSRLQDAILNLQRGNSRNQFNRSRTLTDDNNIKPYVSIVDDIEKNLLDD